MAAIGASSGAGRAGGGSGSTWVRSCLVIRPHGVVRSGPVMAGGLSDHVVARLAALEGGAEATAFLASLVARGRSSYTLRSYGSGLEHFLAWTTARGVELVDVRRAAVDEYVAEFARGERGGVAAGRAPARSTTASACWRGCSRS